MLNVAVFFGGVSCEHDISVITGEQLILNCNDFYNIIPIYIDKNGVWRTGKNLGDIDNFKANLSKTTICSFVCGEKFLYFKKGKNL